jgi:hypothetical protein
MEIRRAEHIALMPINQVPRLFDRRRGKLPLESRTVNLLHGNVVEDLSIKPVPSDAPNVKKRLAFYCHRISVKMGSRVHRGTTYHGFKARRPLPRYRASACRNRLLSCPFALKNDEA